MFLDVTARRNPSLIDRKVELHQKGLLLPDTYILDLDTIEENTLSLVNDAKNKGFNYFT